jgi:hypothetical protein
MGGAEVGLDEEFVSHAAILEVGGAAHKAFVRPLLTITPASATNTVVMKPADEKKKALLLGLGLDNDDGHLRVTRGENFHLVGGSEDTHGTMQEKAVKFNEKLKGRGRRLEDISHEEFRDIAHEIGLSDKNLPPE